MSPTEETAGALHCSSIGVVSHTIRWGTAVAQTAIVVWASLYSRVPLEQHRGFMSIRVHIGSTCGDSVKEPHA